jgi:predicted membrane channel-forming protein YqfA (hemolysin III family)
VSPRAASWAERAALLAAALWWGGATVIGFLVVPLLFMHLPTPAVAGAMAAKLFTAQTWLAVACGLLLLIIFRKNQADPSANRSMSAIVFVLLGMLVALLSEFAVAPRIVARENLRLWHSVGTVLYALQWGCALAVLLRGVRAGRGT